MHEKIATYLLRLLAQILELDSFRKSTYPFTHALKFKHKFFYDRAVMYPQPWTVGKNLVDDSLATYKSVNPTVSITCKEKHVGRGFC